MIHASNWSGYTPIIGFDMDGTLYKWGERLNEILLDLDPGCPVVADDDRVSFGHLIGQGGSRELVAAAMADDRLYTDQEVYEGAIEAVERTYEAGYKVAFVSTPDATNAGCARAKQDQIRKDFGEKAVEHLILTHDKTLVSVDVLVDDKPTITGLMTPNWTRIMMDHSWNRTVDCAFRMVNWSEWDWMLERALSTRRSKVEVNGL